MLNTWTDANLDREDTISSASYYMYEVNGKLIHIAYDNFEDFLLHTLNISKAQSTIYEGRNSSYAKSTIKHMEGHNPTYVKDTFQHI